MAKTKYACVYQKGNGRFYYLVGLDKITGKRIQKKGSKDQLGKPFSSAKEAYQEVIRIKEEYNIANGYANYDLTYRDFMEQSYMPHYQASVQATTWHSRQSGLIRITDFFEEKNYVS